MKPVLLLLIAMYKYLVSPWLGTRCRFYPSCSSYAQESINKYGSWRGVWLGLKRFLRCHPWSDGGYDPVP